jgi:hypothetical protein
LLPLPSLLLPRSRLGRNWRWYFNSTRHIEIPAGCLLFAGEGHGFKKAESIEGALDAARDWYSDISRCLLARKGLPRTQYFLSGTPSKIFSVPISTRIDPAGFLHRRPQRHSALLTARDIPQRARPFADRLVIDSISRRASNDGCKWICVLVEWKTSKFERMPQKSVGPSPHFVMLNCCKDSSQISIHGVPSTAC